MPQAGASCVVARSRAMARAVSYTHLDVYKRQVPLFTAIWKTVQKAINFISYVLLATAIFFAVTGIVFPFVYGPNEIMASIGRFAIASPTFIVGSYLQLLVTLTRRSRLRYDCALIDGNACLLYTSSQ